MTALQQTPCRLGHSVGRFWRTLALSLLAWAALLSPMQMRVEVARSAHVSGLAHLALTPTLT